MTYAQAQALLWTLGAADDADWEPVDIARDGDAYVVLCRDRYPDRGVYRTFTLASAAPWRAHRAALAAAWNAVAAPLGLPVVEGRS